MGDKTTIGRPKGRPKGSYARGTPHCGRLVISCTEQEEAIIRDLAKLKGRSISRYIVELSLEKYEQLASQGILPPLETALKALAKEAPAVEGSNAAAPAAADSADSSGS